MCTEAATTDPTPGNFDSSGATEPAAESSAFLLSIDSASRARIRFASRTASCPPLGETGPVGTGVFDDHRSRVLALATTDPCHRSFEPGWVRRKLRLVDDCTGRGGDNRQRVGSGVSIDPMTNSY